MCWFLQFSNNFFKQNSKKIAAFHPGLSPSTFLNLIPLYSTRDFIHNLNQLLTGIPLSQILHERFFYSLNFYVDERVLTPRFETEILVEHALNFAKEHSVKSILDLGVGPGTILMNLAYHLGGDIEYIGADISSDALNVFKINKFRLSRVLPSNISSVHSDLFSNINSKFDLIVSNPPYISTSYKETTHTSALEHEPEVALFVDQDNYINWFIRFIEDSLNHLNTGGMFMMEGDERKLYEISSAISFESEIINDLTNKPRFIKIFK